MEGTEGMEGMEGMTGTFLVPYENVYTYSIGLMLGLISILLSGSYYKCCRISELLDE